MNPPREAPWPSLPLAEWQATHDTLHDEAVRGASSPDAAVLEFYQKAYDGAVTLARWDRAALDRPPAEWP